MNQKPKRRKKEKFHNINKIGPALFERGAVKIKTETNGLGWLKTFVVCSIIALQLLLIIFLHVAFSSLFTGFLIASGIFSLITCLYVLSSDKNSLSKGVWIIFLLVFFTFGYIIYILSDERTFFRKAKKRYEKVFARSENKPQTEDLKINGTVKNDCDYLYNVGNFVAYKDSKVQYFNAGDLFFKDILERIESAEHFIFMEFFIISDGSLLHRFVTALEKKISEGVEVRLIYDDMGCHKTLSKKTKKLLKSIGVKMFPFNRLVPLFSVALNYRDHRKIVVVDGKTAYTGGCNLADEYINEKRMYGYWKDSGIRVDGKAVDGMTLIFLRQWEFVSKTEENYKPYFLQWEKIQSDSVVVPFADGLDYPLAVGKSVFENAISGAKEKIYIMSPYFIVDDGFNALLMNKALSGVDVRIILPEIADKSMVYGVTRNMAEKLMDYGVKVYLMKNSFVHSKIVYTENCVIVGSINTDLRSFYQQFESAVYTDDKEIMNVINNDFISTIENSVPVTEENKTRRNPLRRIFEAIMQVFAPLM